MIPVKRPDFAAIVRRANRLSAWKFHVAESADGEGYSAQVDGVALTAARFNHREDAEFFALGAADVAELARYALWLEERLGFQSKPSRAELVIYDSGPSEAFQP